MKTAIVFALSSFVAATPSRAQGVAEAAARAELRSTVVFAGTAVTDDGCPARDALVVSSAGGGARTGADGRFELAVDVPFDAESVELTVTLESRARGTLTASTRLLPAAFARTTSVGTLALEPRPPSQPRWLPTFGGVPGLDADVEALVVFDDGSGPALYAGGQFTLAGGYVANHVARWDGERWSPLGNGIDSTVHALVVFDDGSGPALYAGGSFEVAGAVIAHNIARWDGTSWSALAGSPHFGPDGAVHALAIFDDGTGPALYAGGSFTAVGGVAANRVARWDGSTWSAVGTDFTGTVTALAAFDDGSGAVLHAAGTMPVAGDPGRHVARWDGASWIALGGEFGGEVRALAGFDDGSGASLYVGGVFGTIGGETLARIARWDGSTWQGVGSGATGVVDAFLVFDDGSGPFGPSLYVSGGFGTIGGVTASRIARWNATGWSALGAGSLNNDGLALAIFDDGSGAKLYAGGQFTNAGGSSASRMAWWDGTSWEAETGGLSNEVRALATFDDGSGATLHAGGLFTTADGAPAARIVKWDGADWTALGSGLNGNVLALASFDDGDGVVLYAGGSFSTAGGVAAENIARWDGSSWSALGSGTNEPVRAFAVFDDGSGPALYAAGDFTLAGGVAANCIAKWDGSSWTALQGGLNRIVYALTVFDDGSGPALYAGGEFIRANGIRALRIARWDGANWSAVADIGQGLGQGGGVHAFATFDDGNGPMLHVAGDFTMAGGAAASNIARWDGTTWFALGGGTNGRVDALAVADDGEGPALYAGGIFTAVGLAANRIARWDGSSWSALGTGMTAANGFVYALTEFDDGRGPALFAGGAFSVSPGRDRFLAKWGSTRRMREITR